MSFTTIDPSNISPSGVTPGTYTNPIVTVNEQGLVTSATSGQLAQGIQGTTGAGIQGPQGLQGTAGYIGADGVQGIQGSAGYIGADGAQGVQGIVGEQGYAAGLPYIFNSSTVAEDPSSGRIRFNNNTVQFVSQIIIDINTATNRNVDDYILSWNNSTSSVKGHLLIKSNQNLDNTLLVFEVNSIQDLTGYNIVNVTYVSGALPDNDELCVVEFYRSGDRGTQGIAGSGGTGGTGGGSSTLVGLTDVSISSPQAGQVLKYNGTIWINGTDLTGSGGGGGSLAPWSRKTANYTAVNGDRLIADTTNGTFTITLPVTPTLGDYVIITDGSNFSNTNLTVARNGSTIEGFSDNVLLDTTGATYEFIYDGITWQLTATSGPQGAPGIQGAAGYIGEDGAQGIQGLAGLFAAQGLQGVQGIQGPQSIQGIQGIQGSQAAQGIQGIIGSQGFIGGPGIQGIAGAFAAQGIQGIQGRPGTQGVQGLDGQYAAQGIQGRQGIQGDFGSQGVQGVQGLPGQYAAQGIQGVQGLPGQQGTQGLHGQYAAQGVQGTQGLSGSSVQLERHYTYPGTVSVSAGTIKWWNITNATITKVSSRVSVAPIGSSIIAYVKKNNVIVHTINIISGSYSTITSDLNIAIIEGDYITIDIVQAGTSVNGSDLVISFLYTRT
jgi:hypothetical protein